jgi:hypothetical protein
MRRMIALAVLFVCIAIACPNSGTALDYGTKVTIGSEYETSLDLSYRNDPTIVLLHPLDRIIPCDAVWSPDGKQIYFTDMQNIFSVPATGGTPRLLYESYCLYPYNDKKILLDETIYSMVGISSDGKKLYFIRNKIEGASGLTVEIKELDGGYSVGISGSGSIVLQSLDLENGAVVTIVEVGLYGTLSPSKRYFEYYNSGAARIIDLESGKGWELPDSGTSGYSFTNCFTADEQNILYAYPKRNSMKFYTRSIWGGDPEEITGIPGISGAIKYVSVVPGDASILYTLTTDTNTGLCITSLTTGKTVDVVPFSTSISTNHARFSPDGKQICYIRGSENGYELYLKDMFLAIQELGQPTSVADATPKGFALTGNYPNPFNPSTHIAFTLPSAGSAKLSVYDVTGRKVRDLVSAPLSAGTHEMAWDGRDEFGATVSSGTYIACLKMGNFTASHRMMLMK